MTTNRYIHNVVPFLLSTMALQIEGQLSIIILIAHHLLFGSRFETLQRGDIVCIISSSLMHIIICSFTISILGSVALMITATFHLRFNGTRIGSLYSHLTESFSSMIEF